MSDSDSPRQILSPYEKNRVYACLCVTLCLSISIVVIIIGGFYGRTHSTGGIGDMQVQTASGTIVGFEENGVNKFFGVPYAQPPVNELRWKAPQKVKPWQGKKDAKNFGAACPQLPLTTVLSVSFPDQSEDCLFLNIWTPSWVSYYSQSAISSLNLSVLVWMHGGSFTVDDTSDPAYDGSALALQGAGHVVVTVNYRLGVLGFLALSELQQEEGAQNSTGNYGIADTQLALQWVKENIAQFGGNPNRVLLFGESAGGNAMFFHLASPLSKGLFQAVISESGFYRGVFPLDNALMQGDYVLNKTNCSKADAPLDCLRAIPYSDILSVAGGCMYLPVIDGVQLRDFPDKVIGTKDFNNVPFLLGANHDEGSLLAQGWLSSPDSDYLSILGLLTTVYFPMPPNATEEIANTFYPLSDYPSPAVYWALVEFIGDFNMKCSARQFAKLLTKAYNATSVYLYEFSYVPETLGFYLPVFQDMGSYHAAEIPLIWKGSGLDDTPQALKLADQMQSYWTNFGATFNPNSPNTPFWPRYNESDLHIVLDTTITLLKAFNRSDACDFFEPYISNYILPVSPLTMCLL